MTAKDQTTKEQLQERAQLVRIHEANCHIEYPTASEANFRLAIMKKLALEFGLRELRESRMEGPVQTTAVRPGPRRSLAEGV